MQAMMLTVCNCYMLWALFWLQFLSNITFFGYRRFYLNYYTIRAEPFRIALPELFLLLSIGLAVFAVVAVAFGTRETPKLGWRVIMVTIFSAITTGFSATSLSLRGHSYNEAIRQRDEVSERYQKLIALDSSEEWVKQDIHWVKRTLDFRNQEIELFQNLYGVK